MFVANLSFKTTDSQLKEVFSPFGKVVEAHHVTDKLEPEKKRGFAFVSFDSVSAAEAAVRNFFLSPPLFFTFPNVVDS